MITDREGDDWVFSKIVIPLAIRKITEYELIAPSGNIRQSGKFTFTPTKGIIPSAYIIKITVKDINVNAKKMVAMLQLWITAPDIPPVVS